MFYKSAESMKRLENIKKQDDSVSKQDKVSNFILDELKILQKNQLPTSAALEEAQREEERLKDLLGEEEELQFHLEL